ncbi:hypothetical protein F0562_024496 [Nyssa sinensis]|uniref:FRIGIDA-like protein n=1 Tax=Nyssa sinensis TaxID=561372 RepID=A0A5J5BBL9_9ASTE|nr:hypothetical protein F0562_024496 [Nyssa sinensis]
MATKSNCAAPHPPVKAEHDPTPQQSSGTGSVKREPQELTKVTNPPAHTPGNQQIQLQQKQQRPHFINSVTELRELSTALSTFLRRYDELKEHLDFIRTAVDSKWPEHLDAGLSPIVPLTETPASNTEHLDAGPLPPQRLAIVPPTKTPASDTKHLDARPSPPIVPPTETPASDNKHLDAGPSTPIVPPTETPASDNKHLDAGPSTPIVPPTETPASDTKHLDAGPSPPIVPPTETPASDTKHLDARPSPPHRLPTVAPIDTPASDTAIVAVPESAYSEQKMGDKHSSRSEVEYLCEMMCSRGLRKYMVSNLSSIAKLRKEVTVALKLAPKPATLVFQCLGRFYLQGRKAYCKDSPMITARQASVLVLECFLLMGCNDVQIEPSVKEEAELTAVAWRKRLVSEGGVSKACEIDARGLLFLIGCFGIPPAFKNEDVGDLFRPSNAREISDVLRRSNVLLARIAEIIEGMIKNKMEVEAVDIAYTFGLEDRFPPQPNLTSFLRKSKEAWKKTRKAAEGSSTAVNEANKKHLADLKSVIKCLEDHKIDPLKLLPGWKINEKISSLEKDIADFDKKMGEKVMPKRKADEGEFLKEGNNPRRKAIAVY